MYRLIKNTLNTLFILTIHMVFAQEYVYKNYTTEDGLSSSEVYDITQDKKGFLWFATDRGLTRYDGDVFVKYGIPDGLTDIVVFNFYEQPNDKIWCSTFNKKLFYYNPDTDAFEAYIHNDALSKVPAFYVISNLIVGKNEELFITFVGRKGYFFIDSNGDIVDRTSVKKSGEKDCVIVEEIIDSLQVNYLSTKDDIKQKQNTISYTTIPSSVNGFWSIDFSKYNRKVIVTNHGLTIKEKNEVIERIEIAPTVIFSEPYGEHHFWVGLRYGGVKMFNLNGEITAHFLDGKSVTKIYKDHEGGVWISTIEEGVFYVANPLIKLYNKEYSSNPISLTQDNNNTLYVGNQNGVVSYLEADTFKLLKLIKHQYEVKVQYFESIDALILQSPVETHILGKDTNEIWIKSRGNVLSDNAKEFPLFGKSSIYKFQKEGLLMEVVQDFGRVQDAEVLDDTYYLATLNGLLEFKNDSLYNLSEKHELLDSRVDDVDGTKNTLFAASMDAGLIVKRKDTIFSISQKQGLNSGIVNCVYAINDKDVYVGTSQGVNRIVFKDDNTYDILGISSLSGIPDSTINDMEVIGDTLWMTTKAGVCSVPVSSFLKPQVSKNTRLQILKVELNDSIRLKEKERYHLTYSQNTLGFHYTGISFKNDAALQYRYRIRGLNEDWILTGDKFARYQELEPGTYTFQVQVRRKNELWPNEMQAYKFSISAPFWQRLWFIVAVILVVGYIIYLFFKIRILTYNKDVWSEVLRIFLKKIKGRKHNIIVKESGSEIRLLTSDILYAKSSGNYLEVHTRSGKYLIREKISDFQSRLPDTLEFIRIHRSFIIRIDKVDEKSPKYIRIGRVPIPVGKKYIDNLDRIIF